MTDILIHRFSTISGATPTVDQIEIGEIQINTKDGKVFFAKSGTTKTVEQLISTNSNNQGDIIVDGDITANNFIGYLSGTSLNADKLDNMDSTDFATVSGNTFNGNQEINGDVNIKNNLILSPTTQIIDENNDGVVIQVKNDTGDLLFTKVRNGVLDTINLKWLEGNLYTGLLSGGVISATNSGTTFNISAGTGLIVTLNADLIDEFDTTIKYVKWEAKTNISLSFLNTKIQTYIAIDSNGDVVQSDIPFYDGQYNDLITLGTVIHQNLTYINSSITYPNTAYGYKQRTYDFIKAFGPLKLNGLSIIPVNTLGLNVGSGTAWADGRNYQNNPNNPSYITDSGTNISKIFRYYQISGNTFVQDTNNGLGYTTIDPTHYNLNGVLTSVPGTGSNRKWSIQRVFWYPNSATKGIVVYYGNKYYNSSTEAAANSQYEEFYEIDNTKQNAVFLGSIVLRNDALFTDSSSYLILPSGIFRNVGGGSGGGGTIISTRLEDLIDVSITTVNNGDLLTYNNSINKWINSKSLIGDYGVTGNLNVTGNITGIIQYSGLTNIPSTIVTGSTQIYLTGTTGFSTYINQPILTTSNVTFSGITNNGILYGNNILSRDKIRLWNDNSILIGLENNVTFGSIENDYAMTFQMSNNSNRGFWWGDSGHSTSQGAMALSTDGKLTIANSVRIGYGESDITLPGNYYQLDISGKTFISESLKIGSNISGIGLLEISNGTYSHRIISEYNSGITIDTGFSNAFPIKLEGSKIILGTTGNVGIGTAFPNSILDVLYGSSSVRFTHITNQYISISGNTNGNYIYSNGVTPFVFRNNIINELGFLLTSSNYISFENGVIETIRFTHDNNVLIGTTTNSGSNLKLQVSGLSYFNGNILIGISVDSGYQLDVNGVIRGSSDAIINGLTIGKGGGNIYNNTALGIDTLSGNTTGYYNVAVGYRALFNNTTGRGNVGIGFGSLSSNWSGLNNTVIGNQSLLSNGTGSDNIAIGSTVMINNTSGSRNTSLGGLGNNTIGVDNVALGYGSLGGVISSSGNTGVGNLSLKNAVGSNNVALGMNAGNLVSSGSNNTTSNNSIYIGVNTRSSISNQTNQIVIGYAVTGLGSNTTILGNSSTTTTAIYGNLLLGTTTDTTNYKLEVSGATRISNNTFLATSTGNVIIGSTTGTKKLEIVDTSTVTVRLNNTSSTTWDIVNNTGGTLDFVRGATNTYLKIDTNGYVGIGTSSPTTLIHVNGAGTFNGDLTISKLDPNLNIINTTTSTTLSIYAGSVAAYNFNNANGHWFGTQGTYRMKIMSSATSVLNNFGVGTETPYHNLQVGSATFTSQINPSLQIVAANSTDARIGAVTGLGKTTVIRSTSTYGEIFAYDYNGSISQNLIINQYGGNVGIGTTSPISLVDVYGSNGSEIRLSSPTALKYGELVFSSSNTTYKDYGASIEGNGNSVGLNVGQLLFKTGYGTVRTVRMIIDPYGNVGIGTTNPLLPLHIVGTGIQFSFNSSNQYNATIKPYWNSATDTRISFGITPSASGTPSETFHIMGNGNVGIGTTSPLRKLHITSSEVAVGAYQQILEGTSGGYGAGISFQSLFAGTSTMGEMARITADGESSWNSTVSTQVAGLRFYTTNNGSTTEKLRITGNGNVLIGTSTDNGYKLNVSGSINTNSSISRNGESILWGNAGDSYANIRVLQNASTTLQDGMYINYNSTGTSGAHLRFFANGTTERMRIDASTGNVGIGTTIPYSKLQITNPGAIGSHLRFDTGANSGYDFNLDSNSYLRLTYILTGSTYKELVTFAYNGNVGIGTSSPVTPLHIYLSATTAQPIARFETVGTNSRPYIDFKAESSDLGYMGWGGTGSNVMYIWSYLNSDIRLGTNSTSRVTINGSGNVGIGTTSPTNRLTVSSPSGDYGVYVIGNGTSNNNFGVLIDAGLSSSDYTMRVRSKTTSEYFAIRGDGNVGIGTANPTEKLTVYKGNYSALNVLSDTQSSLLLNTTTLNGVNNPNVELYNSYGNVGLVLYPTPSTTYNNIIYYDNTNKETQFQTNGSTKLIIKSNGNVLIGTSTDSGYKLDVTGTFRTTSNSYINGLIKTTKGLISSDNGRILSPPGASYQTTSSVVTGAFKIKLPTAKLNSNTMLRMTVKIYTYNTGKSYTYDIGGYNHTSNNWYNVFAYGMSDNGTLLTVRFGQDATSNCIWIGETGTTWDYPQVFVTDVQLGFIGTDESWLTDWSITPVTSFDTVATTYTPSILLNTKNNPYNVTFNGNVGIGTTTPNSKLEISGGGASATDGAIRLINTAGNQTFAIINGIIGVTNNGFSIRDVTNSADRFVINSIGNVGIGTVSPNAPLQLSNAVQNRKIILYEGGNNDHEFYGFGINSGILRYQVSYGANHIFYAASSTGTSTELLRIQSDGKVGIGVSTPLQALHIQGSILSSTGYIMRPDNAGIAVQFSNGTHTSYGNFNFNNIVGNTTLMSILNNGNVLIGTTTDVGNKLYVNGTARFDGATYFATNLWNFSIDGKNRFYFANNSTTYFGSPNGYIWREASSVDIMLLGNSGSLQLIPNGATNDPYGTISVTQPTTSSYSYYGLTRQGNLGMGMGITTSNQFFIGTTTVGGASSVLLASWMLLTGSNVTFNGSVNTSSTNGYQINGNTVLSASGNYTVLYDSLSNRIAMFIGNTVDPANYYDNNAHSFRSRDGGTSYVLISANGLRLQNYTTTQVNAIASPTGGCLVFDSTTNYVKAYTASGWKSLKTLEIGSTLKTTMLSNSEVTITTTTATSTSYSTFATTSYTPTSSSSYLIIECYFAYTIGGSGTDSFIANIEVDATEIGTTKSTFDSLDRTSKLSPVVGRFTNSSTTAKTINVRLKRNSADDSITILNDNTFWLKITEILR